MRGKKYDRKKLDPRARLASGKPELPHFHGPCAEVETDGGIVAPLLEFRIHPVKNTMDFSFQNLLTRLMNEKPNFRPFHYGVVLVVGIGIAVAANSADEKKATAPKAAIQPHPDAVANSHSPGEVDKPELVPFVVRDPAALPGIVLDETDAELVGTWQYSTHTPPYVGIGYLHDQKSGKGEKSVTWTPDLPKTGRYEVRLSHCYNVRRSTNAPVTIHHAEGETTVRINQQEVPPHGKLFRTLGTFRFEAGKQGFVRVSTDGTEGKYVIADAVQFLWIEEEA